MFAQAATRHCATVSLGHDCRLQRTATCRWPHWCAHGAPQECNRHSVAALISNLESKRPRATPIACPLQEEVTCYLIGRPLQYKPISALIIILVQLLTLQVSHKRPTWLNKCRICACVNG